MPASIRIPKIVTIPENFMEKQVIIKEGELRKIIREVIADRAENNPVMNETSEYRTIKIFGKCKN